MNFKPGDRIIHDGQLATVREYPATVNKLGLRYETFVRNGAIISYDSGVPFANGHRFDKS